MIVYNTGKKTIFIVTEYEAAPDGGLSRPITHCSISPGEGIDLDLVGLKTQEEINHNSHFTDDDIPF